jgi:hypothetical protein
MTHDQAISDVFIHPYAFFIFFQASPHSTPPPHPAFFLGSKFRQNTIFKKNGSIYYSVVIFQFLEKKNWEENLVTSGL